VACIGVQRFVEVLGLFGVLDAWAQIQIVTAGAVIRPAAALAYQRIAAANEQAVTVRTSHQRQ
jgi:hypothetical protein